MVLRQIYALYFSPTGGTEKIVSSIADTLSRLLELPVHSIDFTCLENRQKEYHFPNDSLVIIGTPVYAGRIPNKILPDFKKCIVGAGHTPVIPVCVYGNRNYDEALRELLLLSEENGCIPVAAAAMISQHAFSDTLAKGRPDIQDFKKLNSFSKNIAQLLKDDSTAVAIDYDRTTPLAPYYTPLKADLTPARFLKAKPLTDLQKCSHCGLCVRKCPMNSISEEDISKVTGVCIKCQACIKICPAHAKYFVDEAFLSHVEMLENTYTERKEPTFIITN